MFYDVMSLCGVGLNDPSQGKRGFSLRKEIEMFQKNMGGSDRAVRLALGLGLIASAYVGALGSWAYVGVIPVITAALGSCPAYSIFRFSTCKK